MVNAATWLTHLLIAAVDPDKGPFALNCTYPVGRYLNFSFILFLAAALLVLASMDRPIVAATVQSAALGVLSNVLAQGITAYRAGVRITPYMSLLSYDSHLYMSSLANVLFFDRLLC